MPPPHESPLYDSVDLAEAAVCAFADVGLWLRPPPAIAHRWPDGSMLALTMRNDTGALLTADVEAKARMTGDLVRIEGVGIGPPGNGTLRIDLRGPLAADGSTAPV